MWNELVHRKQGYNCAQFQRPSLKSHNQNANVNSSEVFQAAYAEECAFDNKVWYTSFNASVPQWGAADAETKVPSGENTELKRSSFKVWRRSVFSHTCYAYCQGFLLCLFLPFRSIHLHFFPKPLPISAVLAVATHGSCVGPQNKIGYPAEFRFPCWVPADY